MTPDYINQGTAAVQPGQDHTHPQALAVQIVEAGICTRQRVSA
jgi:hypothetical protein